MNKISLLLLLLWTGFLLGFSGFDMAKKSKTPRWQKCNSATVILSKKEVPILCYHAIRDFKSNANSMIKTYSVTPKAFSEQMKALSDNGFQTILPDQLYNYLLYNKPLPEKPILLTFDDTREEQYRIAASEMDKYGFKGVFFIMTVSINKPGYMNQMQIKTLADEGHIIGSHTWDHHAVDKYNEKDWNLQLIEPQKKLEALTGKPIRYFSYPFGIWNPNAITKIKSQNYKLAFILYSKRDLTAPQFTIRRMIVSGTWSTAMMLKTIKSNFKY
jgi:peptidoglycan/xylan/chitin deacetylase (PgdA/CDA1 family)